jgi:hypothetical protein
LYLLPHHLHQTNHVHESPSPPMGLREVVCHSVAKTKTVPVPVTPILETPQVYPNPWSNLLDRHLYDPPNCFQSVNWVRNGGTQNNVSHTIHNFEMVPWLSAVSFNGAILCIRWWKIGVICLFQMVHHVYQVCQVVLISHLH